MAMRFKVKLQQPCITAFFTAATDVRGLLNLEDGKQGTKKMCI